MAAMTFRISFTNSQNPKPSGKNAPAKRKSGPPDCFNNWPQGNPFSKIENSSEPTLDSIRNTQLYRTVIHEIGHFVDWRNSWGDEEAETAFDTKTSHDKEAFAHAYAERMGERLKRFGVIPFECIFDTERLRDAGLDPADFTPPPRQ